MRVLLADDHDLVRETLGAFLEQDKDTTISLARNLDDALSLIVKENGFDLVLLDYSMPGMNGLSGLEKAIAANNEKPVAIVSGTANKDIADKALTAGAAGFLPKTMAAKSLINAVKFMAMGEIYAPLDFMTAQENENAATRHLTDREKQTLKGIVEGKTNKEIARDIDLQEVTVKLHVKTLTRKLGAKNRTHAAMIARDQHMV